MHAAGHVGVGLGAAAGLVAALTASGLSEAAVPATVLLVGLSTLPDVDEHLPGLAHRGATHSAPFALAVGAATGAVSGALGPTATGLPSGTAAVLGSAVGVIAVVLHVLADVVTPMGVPLLWPLSSERRSLRLVWSADRRVNGGLLLVGALCLAVSLGRVLLATG